MDQYAAQKAMVSPWAIWSALLTPQGKWLADFFLSAEPDRLLLDAEAAQAEMVAAAVMVSSPR